MQLNSSILIFQIIALITAKRTGKNEEKFKSSFKSTVVELYFELCLCFWIMVRSAGENFFDVFSAGDYVSFILGCSSVLILIGVPLYLIFYFEDIKYGCEETDKNLLLDTKLLPESNWKHLLYPMLFFIRRNVFVILAIYKTKLDSSDSYL